MLFTKIDSLQKDKMRRKDNTEMINMIRKFIPMGKSIEYKFKEKFKIDLEL